MPASRTIKAPVEQPASMTEEFSALVILQKTLRFWWVVFSLTVLGAVLGMVFHFLRQPVYEAVGRFSAGIDYVSTGPLTQYEEDTALNAVGDLIQSGLVMRRVVDRASEAGIMLSAADLKKQAVLERKVTEWELRVRDPDSRRAEQIASIWVEEGYAVLQESYGHALQAGQLQRILRSLESCLARAAQVEPVQAQCSSSRFTEIQAEIYDAGMRLSEERAAANGLFEGVTIGPVDQVVVSDQPVLYGRSQLVLAGGLIGLLLGIWLIQTNLPDRFIKRL